MSELTGRPFFGTLPWVACLGLDGEDSLALDAPRDVLPPLGKDTLNIAVVRLPRISNFTDLDAISHEPGVAVRFTHSSQEILAADLAVLPGTKATVADLEWLRSCDLDDALAERARRDLPTLGICGGYQMLGERVRDTIESGEGEAPGLGLLPIETVFEEEKILARPEGRAPNFEDAPVSGYEIRHGRVLSLGGEPLFSVEDAVNCARDGGTEGCRIGSTFGTSWHGVFESDGFRRAFLRRIAAERDLDWVAGGEPFAAQREAQLDRLGDLVAENVDRDALLRLVEDGPPEGLPLIGPGVDDGMQATGVLAARGAGDE